MLALLWMWVGLAHQVTAGDDGQSKSWSLQAGYTGELWAVAAGGLSRDIRYLDNLDLTLDVDLGAAAGLGDTQLFLYGLYNNGETFSDAAGDGQVVSNIEAGVQSAQLFEAWLAHQITASVNLKVGLYDLNSEFAVLEAGGLFIHSAHGIDSVLGLSGQNGPSIFPATSFGARLVFNAPHNLTLRLAIMDAVPGDLSNLFATTITLSPADGALIVAEVEAPLQNGRFIAAHWRYTKDQTRLDETGQTGNSGWYVGAEKTLWQDAAAPGRVASAFVRLGVGRDKVNVFNRYLGAGIRLSGLVPGRPKDEMGIALAAARASQLSRRISAATRTEYNLEATYSFEVTEWLRFQPDIQYIINPSADPNRRNTLVVGLRFAAGQSW